MKCRMNSQMLLTVLNLNSITFAAQIETCEQGIT